MVIIAAITKTKVDALTTTLFFLKKYAKIKCIATTKMLRERIELNVM